MSISAETQSGQLARIDASKFVQRISAYGSLLQNDKILVVKTHSKNWELPGGMPEPGETLRQGLQRELLEEIGIKADVGRMHYLRESFYYSPSGKAYHSLQLYFLVTSVQTPTPAGVTDLAFITPDNVTKQNANKSTYLAVRHMNDEQLACSLWPNA